MECRTSHTHRFTNSHYRWRIHSDTLKISRGAGAIRMFWTALYSQCSVFGHDLSLHIIIQILIEYQDRIKTCSALFHVCCASRFSFSSHGSKASGGVHDLQLNLLLFYLLYLLLATLDAIKYHFCSQKSL